MIGAEHLRSGGPFLLVANHSGGMAMSEILSLVTLYPSELRDVRVAALAHPFAFHLWPMPPLMRALGTVPSSYDAASAALEDGANVLVFPGGDHEAARPFWQAGVVDFNRRKGFLRIAKKANVPIVPMGIAGSHLSVPILWRSDLVLPWLYLVPRLFGLKRYPLSLLGVLGAAAMLWLLPPLLGWPLALAIVWMWCWSPVNLVPVVPTKIRFHVGAPIAPEELFADDDLEAAYDRVEGEVQRLMSSARAADEALPTPSS